MTLQFQRALAGKIFIDAAQKEFIRKSIHLLIALVPTMAFWNFPLTVIMLILGILVYSSAEYLRGLGLHVPVISDITAMASRNRDEGHFVLGPVTLGIGALSALLLYPHPAAAVGIYALAFGDGLSSLAGKIIGGPKIPFTGGKTFSGSLTGFLAVFLAAMFFSDNLVTIFVIAAGASLLEAMPSKDMDNIIIPVGTGLIAYISGL